jgi:hypothetical protein
LARRERRIERIKVGEGKVHEPIEEGVEGVQEGRLDARSELGRDRNGALCESRQ